MPGRLATARQPSAIPSKSAVVDTPTWYVAEARSSSVLPSVDSRMLEGIVVGRPLTRMQPKIDLQRRVLLGDRLRDVQLGADRALRQEDGQPRVLLRPSAGTTRRSQPCSSQPEGRRHRSSTTRSTQLVRLVGHHRTTRVAVAEVELADRAVLELDHANAQVAGRADDVLVEVRDHDVDRRDPVLPAAGCDRAPATFGVWAPPAPAARRPAPRHRSVPATRC